LTSLVFPKKDGNIDKNKLQDMNYFLLKHNEKDKKIYKDNLCYLIKHINSLKDDEIEKYKIIYFPFLNEFIEVSKNREDKVFSSPIYFIFNIDKSFKKSFIKLKNLSIFHKEKYLKSIFKNAQIVFNNYYASNKLYVINHSDLQAFKEELEDKELEKKYPNKNYEYYTSILNKYIDASNIVQKEDKQDFIEILKNFNEGLKSKINNNKSLNTVIENDISSLIGLVNIEKLLEQDNIVKGLLNAYKSSIIPYFKNNKEDDKLNRILYYHPSQYLNDISIKQNTKNTLRLSKEHVKLLQKKHLGSFNSEFAITISQRLALSSYLSPMDIVPVNGPPGTGKTALLRAIFSDYIVKAAIKAKSSYDNVKKDPYSFIDTGKPILGTSSVRQAINNIIEGISGGFDDAKKSKKVLYRRWLVLKDFEADVKVNLVEENCVVPQIRNSENKYENKVLFTSINKIFDYISSLDVQLAEIEYLNKINLISKRNIEDLDDAIKFLFSNINRLSNEINTKIDDSPDNELSKTYEKLDKNERFDTFFISLHLLEAFFILNLKRLNKKSSNGKCPICNNSIESNDYVFQCASCDFKIYKKDKFNDISITKTEDLKALLDNNLEQNDKFYGIKYYDGSYKIVSKDESGSDLSNDINNIYLITPLFPMITVTMHSLFGAFKHKENDEYILIREFFDLVLSDESGMILAPIGLPALYVAKKMVIVGDEKQIEPVYPFDEIVDKSIVDNISSDIDYSKFKKDHSAIFSNFLTIANRSTYFDSFEMEEHEDNSLWLKEHFRCKDEIIEYCNEIIYKGILIPKVRFYTSKLYLDDAKDFYPSMKLFNIDSTVKNNSSYLETKEIVQYLLENICNLTDIYNNHNEKNISYKEFHKHIGIVTPFNNQKKMITRELKKVEKYNLDKILVGTVHAFQGSEREIIIFSPTVDKNYNGIHFSNHDDGNMMNVAVSRAKSAFWVFGSKQGLKNCGEYTKKLVAYIDTNYECEIKCPICNNCINENEKAFKCENYKWDYKTKKVTGCNFIIWKSNKTTNCEINKNNLVNLLTNNEIILTNKTFLLDIKSNSFIKENPVTLHIESTDKEYKECPKCESELKERKGKFGDFYGCSNFPDCNYTEKII
jgi:superfamily I DNA and/or RNA helicase